MLCHKNLPAGGELGSHKLGAWVDGEFSKSMISCEERKEKVRSSELVMSPLETPVILPLFHGLLYELFNSLLVGFLFAFTMQRLIISNIMFLVIEDDTF